MRSINLLSLLSAKIDLSENNFIKYIEQFGINPKIRSSELDDMRSLVEELFKRTKSYDHTNNYYVGFMINQIGKEFDLLRIAENSVINIELKRASNGEKMTKQLVQNHYYLKFLDVAIYNFTYVSSTRKLYMLIDASYIQEVDFKELIDKLNAQVLKRINDLNELFDPRNYLVSPFHSPAAFMEDKYFLNAQQSTYKREIINLKSENNPVFIAIKGGPGTGKTLLTYDIAKEYMRLEKKVIIFNCGKLNTGHNRLIHDFQWPIKPISNYNPSDDTVTNLFDYELVIFDEAQRIYKRKLLKLMEILRQSTLKCIFSFDPNQVLTSIEIEDNVPKLIEENLNPHKYELTNIIRHNKEISSFIDNLFDLSRPSKFKTFKNVSIQYFSSKKATKEYLLFLRGEGWKIIDYTETSYIENPDNDHSINTQANIDGQEFDDIVAIIDDTFYYKPSKKLTTKISENPSYYFPTKMLYQNISRTRRRLQVVVINNPDVLNRILRILNTGDV